MEDAYRHVKTRILSAKLGPGAALNEQEIAAALGISRTPVREAIRKLEQEGLARRYPNRGVLVTPLSLRDAVEIWQIREALEPLACRAAATRIDETALAGIEKAMAALRHVVPGLEDYEAHHRWDLELHGLILEASGNATLRQVVETLNGRVMQARMVNSPARFHRSLEEHLAIVAALKAGDPAAAEATMRAHLESARENLVRPT